MKVLLTILTFLPLTQTVAQTVERENSSTCIISDKYSALDTAIGWSVTADGYWMKSLNRIPNPAKELDSIKLGYDSWYATGLNNFLTIQLRKITIQTKDYILYIRKYIKGDYKYPTIREGWEAYNAYDFFIFEKSELSKIFDQTKTLNNAYESNIISLYSKVGFGYGDKDINLDKIKEWVGKFIANPRVMIDMLTFRMFPIKSKTGQFVRFDFENRLSNSTDKFDPKTFDKKYFEVPYQIFQNFITKVETL